MAYRLGEPLDYDPFGDEEDSVVDSPLDSPYSLGEATDYDPFENEPKASDTNEPDGGGHSLWDIPRMMGKGAAGVAKTSSIAFSLMNPTEWANRGIGVIADLTQNEALQSYRDYSQKHSVSAKLRQYGETAEDYYDEKLTPAMKKSMEKTILASGEEEGFWGPGIKDPWKIGGMIAESLPSTALSMGSGALVTKGLAATGFKNAPKIVQGVLQKLVKKYGVNAVAGAIGGGTGEGVYSGLDNANQAFEEMMATPQAELSNSATYQEIFNSLPEKFTTEQKHAYARKILSMATGGFIGSLTAVSTGILGAPSGAFVGKLMGGQGGKSFWGNLLKGAFSEGIIEEAPQSGMERLITNFTKKFLVDPNQKLLEGTGEAMASGAIAGMVMGGAMAGVAGREGKKHPIKPELESDAKKILQGNQGDITARDILLGPDRAEQIRKATEGKQYTGEESIEAEEEAGQYTEEELAELTKEAPGDRKGGKQIPGKKPQRQEPKPPPLPKKGEGAPTPGGVFQTPRAHEETAIGKRLAKKSRPELEALASDYKKRMAEAEKNLKPYIDGTYKDLDKAGQLVRKGYQGQVDGAKQALDAINYFIEKAPAIERRKEPGREAPVWDKPFRAIHTKAQKQTEDQFVKAAAALVKKGDAGFLDLAKRLGQTIEPGYPLEGKLKTIYARIKSGAEPRKRTEEMSKKELKEALTTDYLTGLGNKHAFEIEDPRKTHVASIDLDSLKYFNDAFGHQTGDEMLKNFGEALKPIEGSYHISGDEFIVQNDDTRALQDIMENQIPKNLAANPITVTLPDGKKIKYEVQFSYGTSKTISDAEQRLQAHKAEREATGQRAGRGEIPAGLPGGPTKGRRPGDKRKEVPKTEVGEKPKKKPLKPEDYNVSWEPDYSELSSPGAIVNAIKAFRKDKPGFARLSISDFWRLNFDLVKRLPLNIQQQFVDKWNKITGHVITLKDLEAGPLTNEWGEDWDEYMAAKGPERKPYWKAGYYVSGQLQYDGPSNGETVKGKLYISNDRLMVKPDKEYNLPDLKAEYFVNRKVISKVGVPEKPKEKPEKKPEVQKATSMDILKDYRRKDHKMDYGDMSEEIDKRGIQFLKDIGWRTNGDARYIRRDGTYSDSRPTGVALKELLEKGSDPESSLYGEGVEFTTLVRLWEPLDIRHIKNRIDSIEQWVADNPDRKKINLDYLDMPTNFKGRVSRTTTPAKELKHLRESFKIPIKDKMPAPEKAKEPEIDLGERRSITGVEMRYDARNENGGVLVQLWRSTGMPSKSAVRMVDTDSDNVIDIKTFPNYTDAIFDYLDKRNANVKADPPDRPDDARTEATGILAGKLKQAEKKGIEFYFPETAPREMTETDRNELVGAVSGGYADRLILEKDVIPLMPKGPAAAEDLNKLRKELETKGAGRFLDIDFKILQLEADPKLFYFQYATQGKRLEKGSWNKATAISQAVIKAEEFKIARAKKAEGPTNRDLTTQRLGDIGTKIRFKKAINKEVLTITHIAYNGKVSVDGGNIYRPASEFEAISPEELKITAQKDIEMAMANETKVITPGNPRGYNARYAVVESDVLIPSHNAQTFQKNPDYPEGVQERTYHTDTREQEKVIKNAQHLSNAILLSDDPTPVSGPPIITPSGIVLGGNSRTMSIARAYRGKLGDRYKEALASGASKWGLSSEFITAMDKPVLVRRVYLEKGDIKTLHRMASDFNKSLTQGISQEAEIASMGKNISMGTVEKIGLRMANRDLTLRELLGKKDGLEVLKWLIDDDVIPVTDENRFVDRKVNLLNEPGKILIENALFGSIIDDADLIAAAPKALINKIGRALPSLARIKARGDQWNITPELKDALQLATEAHAADLSIREHLAQGSLFGDKKEYDNATVGLAELLAKEKQIELAKRFKNFAADAMADVKNQGFLFEPKSFQDAFNDAFDIKISDRPSAFEAIPAELMSPKEYFDFVRSEARAGRESGITFKEKVEIEETGEPIERETDAVAYLNEIEDELAGYRELLKCVKGAA